MHDESGRADRGGAGGGGTVAEAVPVERPQTVLLSHIHRTRDFRCAKSERIHKFFEEECPNLLGHNYCRVFVLPNPDDASEVWGFYSLSPSALARSRTTGSEQKRIPLGIAVPMMLIGFMGRHDDAPNGLGTSLIVDAARRVYLNSDLAAWGLMLDSEGGQKNAKLWEWYQKRGFVAAKHDPDSKREPNPNGGVMYAALKKLIPELSSAQLKPHR